MIFVEERRRVEASDRVSGCLEVRNEMSMLGEYPTRINDQGLLVLPDTALRLSQE